MFIHFDRHERDRQTDRQTQTDGETDGRTLHDGIGRADAQTREEKWQLNDTAALSVLVQV